MKLALKSKRKKLLSLKNVNFEIFIYYFQGINLTSADTCIIYDSDWNPQQDLQVKKSSKTLALFLILIFLVEVQE